MTNIDELTIGQARDLAKLFPQQPAPHQSPFIGKCVVVRCRDAGVHMGYLEWQSGREVRISQSRRLWYWKAKEGAFLSAVATYGLDASSKLGTRVDIHLTETCEIIPASTHAEATYNDLNDYTP